MPRKTKPSTTATRRRPATQPAQPVKPEPVVEQTPPTDDASQGDTKPPQTGEDELQASTTADTATATQTDTETSPVAPADPAVEAEQDPAQPEPVAQPPAQRERVLIGNVEGVHHRVPRELVESLLADTQANRIVNMLTHRDVLGIQQQMLATEGRCAPIFFTQADENDEPAFFAGIEGLCAAINLDLPTVSVVTFDTKDAGAAQSYLIAARHQHSAGNSQNPASLVKFVEALYGDDEED